MATFTSGNSCRTAWAITCEVGCRRVGRGSGTQSNSPASFRCRSSSDSAISFRSRFPVPSLLSLHLARTLRLVPLLFHIRSPRLSARLALQGPSARLALQGPSARLALQGPSARLALQGPSAPPAPHGPSAPPGPQGPPAPPALPHTPDDHT